MMVETRTRLVADYLDDLSRAARGLPRNRRKELLAEISAHIEAALSDAASEADVRSVLDRLGTPADIMREATPPRARIPSRELWAIILILVGGVLLPVIGWIIGVVLLWTSGVWTLRDKLIGTLVVPGGLGAMVLFGAAAATNTTTCRAAVNGVAIPLPPHTSVAALGPLVATTCSPSPSAFLGLALLIVLLLAPFATAVYLGVRSRQLIQESP